MKRIREETETASSNLNFELKIEGSIKIKFQCDICQKLFSSKQCLREHKYCHTNEKPYICAECNKSFRHASQLTLHKKSHLLWSSIKWVKLTDLLRNHKKKKIFDLNNDFKQVILPPITQLQQLNFSRKINLPTISDILSSLVKR